MKKDMRKVQLFQPLNLQKRHRKHSAMSEDTDTFEFAYDDNHSFNLRQTVENNLKNDSITPDTQ